MKKAALFTVIHVFIIGIAVAIVKQVKKSRLAK